MLSSPQGSKTAAKDGSTPAASSSESRSDGNTLTNLPLKLHALLDEAEKLGKLDVVSWESNGNAFKVHDKKRFVAEIMPKYFSTSNYQSFQRYVLFLFAFAIAKNASWLLKLILLTVWIFSSQLLCQIQKLQFVGLSNRLQRSHQGTMFTRQLYSRQPRCLPNDEGRAKQDLSRTTPIVSIKPERTHANGCCTWFCSIACLWKQWHGHVGNIRLNDRDLGRPGPRQDFTAPGAKSKWRSRAAACTCSRQWRCCCGPCHVVGAALHCWGRKQQREPRRASTASSSTATRGDPVIGCLDACSQSTTATAAAAGSATITTTQSRFRFVDAVGRQQATRSSNFCHSHRSDIFHLGNQSRQQQLGQR